MKLSYLVCVFLLLVSCQQGTQQLTKISAKNIAIDSSMAPSAAIDEMIAPYTEQLTGEMQQVLTHSSQKLTKEIVSLQSTMGNLLADLSVTMANPIFKETHDGGIDFALFNYGGIRATLPEGPITKEHAFKLMPFDNAYVVVTLSGEKVKELVAYFMKNKAAHPLSKNIALHLTGSTYTLNINGEPFDPNKTYNVLTTDYLQGGGDRMNFFKDPVALTVLDYKMRDAIIDYFEKEATLATAIDNRVTVN